MNNNINEKLYITDNYNKYTSNPNEHVEIM